MARPPHYLEARRFIKSKHHTTKSTSRRDQHWEGRAELRGEIRDNFFGNDIFTNWNFSHIELCISSVPGSLHDILIFSVPTQWFYLFLFSTLLVSVLFESLVEPRSVECCSASFMFLILPLGLLDFARMEKSCSLITDSMLRMKFLIRNHTHSESFV